MNEVLITAIGSMITAFITWFFARRKNNAEAKEAELDVEVKAADFYKSLLDHAAEMLEQANQTIKERDQRIELLINEVSVLTGELRKYKQLNGKI